MNKCESEVKIKTDENGRTVSVKRYLKMTKDSAPFDLEAHDRKYHSRTGGWRPGIKCQVREALKRGDSADKIRNVVERMEASMNPRSATEIGRDVMRGKHVSASEMNRWARSPKGQMQMAMFHR